MSAARRPPIEQVGAVGIYVPTGSSPYFRLKWLEPDGERLDTSGGKTLEHAELKAADIDARLGLAAGPSAVTSLKVMVDEFLEEGCSPYKDKKPWKASYKVQIEDQMHRNVRKHEHFRAMDVDLALCDSMRAQAGTWRMVKQNTTALRAFLRWGLQKKYFTPAQAELLPSGVSMPDPSIMGTEMPARRRRARNVGEREEYMRDEDAPSLEQVVALRQELARARPAWGALSVELGNGSGPPRTRTTWPSRVPTRPTPSVTCRIWPTACRCQLVCAPGVNRTSATVVRDGSVPL